MIEIINGKPWRCKKGHVLGIVVRRNKVTRLAVLRRALNSNEPEDVAAGRTDVVVELDSGIVGCSICGDQRRWVPGEVAIRKLLGRVPGALEAYEKEAWEEKGNDVE